MLLGNARLNRVLLQEELLQPAAPMRSLVSLFFTARFCARRDARYSEVAYKVSHMPTGYRYQAPAVPKPCAGG